MSAIRDDEGRGVFLFREGGTLTQIRWDELPLDRYAEHGGQERMVVPDGVVGEGHILADGFKCPADAQLESLTNIRGGFLRNVVPVQSVTHCRGRHVCAFSKLFSSILALFDELFQIDLTLIRYFPTDTFL